MAKINGNQRRARIHGSWRKGALPWQLQVFRSALKTVLNCGPPAALNTQDWATNDCNFKNLRILVEGLQKSCVHLLVARHRADELVKTVTELQEQDCKGNCYQSHC